MGQPWFYKFQLVVALPLLHDMMLLYFLLKVVYIYLYYVTCRRINSKDKVDSSVGRAVDCKNIEKISIDRWFKSGLE